MTFSISHNPSPIIIYNFIRISYFYHRISSWHFDSIGSFFDNSIVMSNYKEEALAAQIRDVHYEKRASDVYRDINDVIHQCHLKTLRDYQRYIIEYDSGPY